mgnify:CR=1 FL=1
MKECILIGGGSSIAYGRSLSLFEKIKDKEVWSINFAFLTMQFLPARQIFLDISFFRNNIDKLQELYLKGVPCYTKKHNKYAGIPEIIQYETTRNPNEMNSKMFVGRMGLSGIFALSLALKENYDRIFILGFDFGSITNDKNTHYYQHELKVNSSGFGMPELYVQNNQAKNEVQDFEIFQKEALIKNIKIYNISPLSRIDAFPKISYEEFFKLIEGEYV